MTYKELTKALQRYNVSLFFAGYGEKFKKGSKKRKAVEYIPLWVLEEIMNKQNENNKQTTRRN